MIRYTINNKKLYFKNQDHRIYEFIFSAQRVGFINNSQLKPSLKIFISSSESINKAKVKR